MTALRPMTDAEFAAWRAMTIPGYAAEKVASGEWAEQESLALSERDFEKLLPQGLATPDHHLCSVTDGDGVPVGVLWFAVKSRGDARIAYVYDVAIKPEHRRRGHAQAAFEALEQEARRLELSGIALHVFGHNKGAHALYEKLGFEPTNIQMFKRVGAAGA